MDQRTHSQEEKRKKTLSQNRICTGTLPSLLHSTHPVPKEQLVKRFPYFCDQHFQYPCIFSQTSAAVVLVSMFPRISSLFFNLYVTRTTQSHNKHVETFSTLSLCYYSSAFRATKAGWHTDSYMITLSTADWEPGCCSWPDVISLKNNCQNLLINQF